MRRPCIITMERKTKKEKKDAKSRIVSAAWQLFHEKGYGGTTVDDIIALSDTSKGSFYYYFNTKDELLNTLSVVLDDYYGELEAELDPGMNSFDKLLYLNGKVHAYMQEKMSAELLGSLYSAQLVTAGDNSLLDQNRTYYRLITKLVEEGQKRGQIRADMPVSAITKYYAMCERALVSDWCMNKGSYQLGDYSRECMAMMMEHFRV